MLNINKINGIVLEIVENIENLEVLDIKSTDSSAKRNIRNLSMDELKTWVKDNSLPGFRAAQIFEELYKHKSKYFLEMTTLPMSLRVLLDENFEINPFIESKKQVSVDGSMKFLFKLADGKSIEAVYMPWVDEESGTVSRTTLCISSQVGCAVDCKFCATGTLGFKRNLDVAEIISQVIEVEHQLYSKITNIVFMGMGEPLLNYRNVMASINIFTHEKADFFTKKRITLSTSGIVPKIYRLAEEKNAPKLAISLHATTNGVRDIIVPMNKKGDIAAIMDAVENYYRKTKMPITYEYIPFKDLNDTENDAKRLAKFAKRVPSRINIIPFNDISFTNPTGVSATLLATSKEKIAIFAEQIKKHGGIAIVRDTFGDDIDAACGQLALSDKKGVK